MGEPKPSFSKVESNESLEMKAFRVFDDKDNHKYLIYQTSGGQDRIINELKNNKDGEIFVSENGSISTGKFVPEYTTRKEDGIIVMEDNIIAAGGDTYRLEGSLSNIQKWVAKNLKGDIEWRIDEKR